MNSDVERIEAIIAEANQRYQAKGGHVSFAGTEGGIVRVAPSGFCWT